MKTSLRLIVLICGLSFLGIAYAASNQGMRYFEGQLTIEKSGAHKQCQSSIGKARDVQLSWKKTGKGRATRLSGWMVFSKGAPGKLEGASPLKMTVTANYFDPHLNTVTTLELEGVDGAEGKVTGILRETPTKQGLVDTLCYWEEARLTLTDKTAETNVVAKQREHAARYRAYAHESLGDYYDNANQFLEAATAHDMAIAEVDGVLPESHAYFKGLLNYTAILYFKTSHYEQAAQRLQRFVDITQRQSNIGAEDPAMYYGWVRLATYLYFAKRTDEAVPAIERAARLEDSAPKIDLDSRLMRLQIQGLIYAAAGMFDKAITSCQEGVRLASAEAGPNDLRTYKARLQLANVFLSMKDNARFETTFEPLLNEINTRFGEAHALARENNAVLGTHYYGTDAIAKARPWLEKSFRGHRTLVDSAVQAVQEDENAKVVLAALLDIYMRQGIVPKDFLERVQAGEASLDDLPFQESIIGNLGLPLLGTGKK
ncbi:tetratricopeptide repeat protein [Propionivibrio sp.]|uniref:tetratricopeptide repeat protein n=1 Tax=Propionivibrio sp. TaxID=2212460 RepID=UPI003BF1A317